MGSPRTPHCTDRQVFYLYYEEKSENCRSQKENIMRLCLYILIFDEPLAQADAYICPSLSGPSCTATCPVVESLYIY